MSGSERSAVEAAVLDVLRSATDVRAGSVELASQVTSWELAYHFAPQRLDLLVPLRMRPGLRVVDIGCGSGVLTRALGEAGADVLGIETVAARAEAAEVRCRDLPGVRIVRDSPQSVLADVEEQDLALVCGGLEVGQPTAGARELLSAVADGLSARGVLVLAVDNQLSLKYLLGGTETDSGRSWIGLADYPGRDPGPRAWTRAALGALLDDIGLTAQRWLLPYPDHRLPRVILDDRIFRRPDAAELVEKLVRDPLHGAFGGNDTAVGGRSPQRMLTAEGLGAATAPSFLVLAAFTEAALDQAADPGLAWLISGGRRPQWRRARSLDDRLVLHTVDQHGGPSATRPHPWLRQRREPTEELVPGRALDAHLLDALRLGHTDRVHELLDTWRRACLTEARARRAADPVHPYLPGRPGVAVLPADHLDVHPGNFIVRPDGALIRVDREWVAGDGVDAELVLLRGLLEFAREIVVDRAAHPWSTQAATVEVLGELCAHVDLATALRDRWAELVIAEAALQEAVAGHPAERTVAVIEQEDARPAAPPLWQRPGGLAALRDSDDELVKARADVAELTCQLGERERETDLLRHQLDLVRGELDHKDDRIGMAFAELAAAADAGRALSTGGPATEDLPDAVNEADPPSARIEHEPMVRLVRGARDLALARPGAEPDDLLRRASVVPGLVPLLASRYRRRARSRRDIGLTFDLPVPSAPMPVGAGNVVELDGWVAHPDLPVRAAWLVAAGRSYPMRLGSHQSDGRRLRLRLPLAGTDATGEIPLLLRVELADSTVLDRELPPVPVRSRANGGLRLPSWPAEGPRVAICLASYRPDAGLLAEQLDSVRAQTHANWVCLIHDDGSGEEHLRTIRQQIDGDERFVLRAAARNVGFYRNFERALEMVPADADAVALCDQDDVWDPDKLVTLLAALDDPGVRLAYSDMRLIDRDGRPLAPSFWDRRVNQCHDLGALLLLNTITGAASLASADLVRERVLPFPPGTPSAFHDQWLAACALAAGTVAFVDRPLQSYRQHHTNVTGRRQDPLDAGLPGPSGWLGLALGADWLLTESQRAELAAVAEYELCRVAQFATVLLQRNSDSLAPRTRAELTELRTLDRRLVGLAKLAARAGWRGRPETDGAERRLLAAGLYADAVRRRGHWGR